MIKLWKLCGPQLKKPNEPPTFKICIRVDEITPGFGEFATFPISYEEYMKLWYEVLKEGGITEYWQDQGWNKDDEFPFPEARYYFEYNGCKFIINWLTGQGDANLLLFPSEEHVPWDESKKIIIQETGAEV